MIFTKPEPTWLGTGALPVLAGADGSDSVTGTEVLALGGMIQEQANKTSNQIPLLGDIPGLGAAFSNRGDQDQKTELVILITPKDVRDGTESRLVTEEYRRKRHVYMPHTTSRESTPANTMQRIISQ